VADVDGDLAAGVGVEVATVMQIGAVEQQMRKRVARRRKEVKRGKAQWNLRPDGGPDVGVRGNVAPPVLQSAQKAKTDGQ
jgi:hypothetical protein